MYEQKKEVNFLQWPVFYWDSSQEVISPCDTGFVVLLFAKAYSIPAHDSCLRQSVCQGVTRSLYQK